MINNCPAVGSIVKLEESGGDGGMEQKIGVTVQDILQLDCMRQTKVVAGHQGLTRIVSNVNVMEVPDIGNWVSSGDLLLTTAYSMLKPALFRN